MTGTICCPDRGGDRGRPYTPHWFIVHEPDGSPDLAATWRWGLPKTDLELASLVSGMMSEAGAYLLHGTQTGRWLMWDGSGRYAPQAANFAVKMTERIAWWVARAYEDTWEAVRENVQRLPEARRADALKRAKEDWGPQRAFRTRIWNDAGQKGIRSQLAEVFSVDDSRLDAGTGRIVVDNGVIDWDQVVAEGRVRLLPHEPDDLATMRTGPGVRWEPDARCPAFDRFMRESVPDDDQRAWLLWRVGCTLFGRMPRKGFLNLIGVRDSGKSTFTDLIAWLAGDYAKSVPVETFLSKHSGDQGFRQHELMGARFIHTHEPNPGALYDVSFMKTLTGRDRMRTRTVYERPVEWVPQCTPFIGSNNPIRFSTSDDAMMSRQEAVLFTRGYAVPDEFLAARLRGELPGILRVLMEAVAAWRGAVPELPLSIITLREQMAVATEDALEFVAEWISEGRLRETDAPAYRCVSVSALYRWYRDWCDDAGVRPAGRKTFSAVVGRKYTRMPSNGTRFTGLELSGS